MKWAAVILFLLAIRAALCPAAAAPRVRVEFAVRLWTEDNGLPGISGVELVRSRSEAITRYFGKS